MFGVQKETPVIEANAACMSTMPPMPPSVRGHVVRRLSIIYALAVAVQAGLYIAVLWVLRAALSAAAVHIAAHATAQSAALNLVLFGTVVAIGLILALVIGFFGGRSTLRAMRSAVPSHLAMPTAPVTWAALSAGILIACIDSFVALTKLNAPGAVAWIFILLRDALTVALLWFGALRSINNPRGLAIAAPFVPRGGSLTQRT